MSKSADAFRTISEVADWLGVQAHVLRFWESKFTQIKPVKRAGGRRYYRPADMLLLGGIRKLLHTDGLSIKEVQAILRDLGIGHVSQLSHGLDTDGPPSEDTGYGSAAAERSAESDIAPTVAAVAPPTGVENLDDDAQALAVPENVAPSFAPPTHSEWARLSEASSSKDTKTSEAVEPRPAAGMTADVTSAPLAAEPVSSAAETAQMDMLLDTPAPAAPASPEPEPSVTEPPEQPLHGAPAEPDPTAMAAAVEDAPLETALQDDAAAAATPDHPEPTEAPLDSTVVLPDDLMAQPSQAPAGETVLPMFDAEPGSDTSPRPDGPVFDSLAPDAPTPDNLAADPDPAGHDSAAIAAATDAPNLDAVAEAEAAVPEQEPVPSQDQPSAQGLDDTPFDTPLQEVALGAATEQVPPSPFADVLTLLAQTKSLPPQVQDEAAACLDELRAIASQR
ncbi:MerR family transcriptional regulator [Pseudophaeobacter flagellatus]|uniref:MerR family transcriptional regulator n=1 Tax=Pseudophaeobacter flagellatus TaxID=2899119 RepID=UPI001E4D8D99|nr:MerR family transcriptional regulator [Pseudophaeobacter flagellatus]MCD9146674.1 MerR family transcriptional regulator [Pseudophaeobacter flagellatus]